MNDRERLATVESYRRHLAAHWQIRPREDSGAVEELLDPDDRASLIRWRSQLLASADAVAHARFYDWLAHSQRFGTVHSLKWMEMLTGGVWAAAVLAELAPHGAVLDLGSGAGYWTAWLAAQRGGRVVGVDACAAAIELGRRRCAEGGLSGELRLGDFEHPVAEPGFAAAVSLQGLTRHFHCGRYDVLGKVVSNLSRDGYLLLVDELPDGRAEYDGVLAAAGLGIVGAGPVGGLGIDGEWKSYLGLVLERRDAAAGCDGTLAQAGSAVERLWQEVHPFATADGLDWTQRNTAYWWAGGGEGFIRL